MELTQAEAIIKVLEYEMGAREVAALDIELCETAEEIASLMTQELLRLQGVIHEHNEKIEGDRFETLDVPHTTNLAEVCELDDLLKDFAQRNTLHMTDAVTLRASPSYCVLNELIIEE